MSKVMTDEISLLDQRVGVIIRGIASILIMLGHVVPRSRLGWEELLLGADWVGVFFFFSGYGLCVSYERRGSWYRKGFVKRKMTEVFVPFLAAEIGYLILYLLIRPNWTTPYNGVLWFVPEILGCYALFSLYMLLDESGIRVKWVFLPAYIIFMIVCITFFQDMNYIYMSTHCFLAGVYLKPFLVKILQRIVGSKHRFIFFGTYWILYVLMVYCEYQDILPLGPYKRYLYLLIKMMFILMFIPVLGIFTQKLQRIPNVSPALEKMPYYIYLWHMAVNLLTKNDAHPLQGAMLCVLVTIGIAYVLAGRVGGRIR